MEQEVVFSEVGPEAMDLILIQHNENVRGVCIIVAIDVARYPVFLTVMIRESLPFAQTLYGPYAFLYGLRNRVGSLGL